MGRQEGSAQICIQDVIELFDGRLREVFKIGDAGIVDENIHSLKFSQDTTDCGSDGSITQYIADERDARPGLSFQRSGENVKVPGCPGAGDNDASFGDKGRNQGLPYSDGRTGNPDDSLRGTAHYCSSPRRMRVRNSIRVFSSFLNVPSIALVVATEFCFSTPRINMQR